MYVVPVESDLLHTLNNAVTTHLLCSLLQHGHLYNLTNTSPLEQHTAGQQHHGNTTSTTDQNIISQSAPAIRWWKYAAVTTTAATTLQICPHTTTMPELSQSQGPGCVPLDK